ncbi:MAG: hypothetical protein KF823_07960 [Xanthomonadales bacterium]|nr:hypothetical protein [Xanthomonadales bacterium]
MTIRTFAALLALLLSAAVHANPLSWQQDALRAIDQVPTRQLAALDITQLAEEDAFNEAMGQPPRFAIAHPELLNVAHSADWEQSGDASIWRLRVKAANAVSVNFGFTRFRLPEGAALYLYSADRSQLAGPYTAAHNNVHDELWTPIIAGDEVIVELNVPTERRPAVQLELGSINQGYRGFGDAVKEYLQPDLDLDAGGKQCKDGGGRSGACNQDVACLSDGDPWNEPRRSVGAYSRSGTFACSGSLVNNTANDRRPLFMTATHCINAAQAPSIVVYWNYEWPSCRRPGAAGGTSTNPPNPATSSSGGTWLAATVNPFSGGGCTVGSQCSDMTLIELNNAPNPDWNLFWSGWDRRPPPTACAQGAPNTTDGLCASIHHPGVHEKRITFVAQDIQVGNIAAATGVHWHPFWHPNPPELPNMPGGAPAVIPPAVTEGGSSGSPLYTAAQRFIGVLSGGPAACGATGANLSDFYGQLAHAWEGLGTPSTRMRDYLDPIGGAPLFIDGIGVSPFALAVDPATVAACASAGSVALDIDVLQSEPGFTGTVALSAAGQPTGSTVAFAPPSVVTPGSSVLTVGALGAATPGNYALVVTGTSGGDEVNRTVPFVLNDVAPGAVGLSSPANNAVGVSFQPTLTWSAASSGGATSYLVEVASDAGFGTLVFSQTVDDLTSVQVSPALASNTSYWWRVTAANACGTATPSAVFTFKTQPAPGDCDDSTTPVVIFTEDFTGGLGGFSTAGSVGAQTWAVSNVRPSPLSGGNAALAVDIPTVSDQRLTSPTIALPAADLPLTLKFQNWRNIENNGATACYDGGILEVSVNGGAFTQITGAGLLNDPYRGPISASFANPLAGLNAWCEPAPGRPYDDTLVDLSPYAGSNVQLRWRLGTDNSVAREGWYVDDIRVQACQADNDLIFADGFEAP